MKAYNSYNAALRITPTDSSITEKANKAMNALAGTNSSASHSNTNYSGSNSSNTNQGYVYNVYLRYAILILALFYILPLGYSTNMMSYKLLSFCFGLDQLSCMVKRQGMPASYTMNGLSEYMTRSVTDIAISRVMLALFVGVSVRSYLFAVMPMILITLTAFSGRCMTKR